MASQNLHYKEWKKWKCTICDYVYDPSKGDPTKNIEPRTPFVLLPGNWVCPACGASKEEFLPNDKK